MVAAMPEQQVKHMTDKDTDEALRQSPMRRPEMISWIVSPACSFTTASA